ncbi:MAG: 3-carboxy-cis,cis-muconate cycloisomerase [Candidatus Acidiferrum sp.]
MNLLDKLFRSEPIELVFSDSEYLQSLLHFEAALARAEAETGLIAEATARAIVSKCQAELFDQNAITAGAALAGNVAIPVIRQLTALVAGDDKEAAHFVHWGATSQDAIDTAAVLQLRRANELIEHDLRTLIDILSALAEAHRQTPVVARTWMQQALPTTFGFIVAGWLDAILRDRVRLEELRARSLTLQFGGAVGTLAALGDRGPTVAKALAADLRLALPAAPWHSHRDRFAEVATTLALFSGTLSKIACDISLHAQTEIGELSEPVADGRGASSTMPHKRNPLTCAVVLANGRRVPGLVSTMLSCMVQEQQRGLGTWHAEWETLPEIVRLTGGASFHLARMLSGLVVHTERMKQNLDLTNGLIFAEAVTFALAKHIGKSRAHDLVETACKKAIAEKRHLRSLLEEDSSVISHIPRVELNTFFDATNYLGSSELFIDNVLSLAKG